MADKKQEYESSQLYRIRHSAAHIMAQAVLEKFPDGKVAIGPPIEDGFYYDFELPRPLTPEDLEAIEKRMRGIIQGKVNFERKVISADEAKILFKDQPFKLELIAGLEEGKMDEDGNPVAEKPEISIYSQGGFVDLCRGPHITSSNEINPQAIKLMSVAGAYWRGDEKRPMLQRIYGTAWSKPDELKDYLWRVEEAKKRDHRKVGHDLDLYSVHEDIGAGLILWHPKGGKMRKIIENFWSEEHEKSGYDFVYTPHIGKAQSLGNKRSSGFLQREHVLSSRYRWTAVLPQTHELPLPFVYL